MKVLLISQLRRGVLCPNLSVYHLAAVLRQAGHRVDARVLLLEDETENLEYLQDNVSRYDAIGVSSLTLSWAHDRTLVKLIKSMAPRVPVILGGVHPTHLPRHTLEVSEADLVVSGEGETSLPRIIDLLGNGRSLAEQQEELAEINGITYRCPDGAICSTEPGPRLSADELDQLPIPAYDLLLPYRKDYSLLPYESSRGCRFNCFFCSIPGRKSWRGKSAARVVEELATISREHSAAVGDGIILVDDCFTADKQRVIDICQGLQRERFTAPLLIEARADDLLDDELLDALELLNIGQIQVGLECGYAEGLRRVRKGVTLETITACAERLDQRGLSDRIFYSFIIGFPWEGEQEIFKTIDFAADLALEHGGIINVAWYFLYPSYGWDQRHEYGIELDESVFDTLDTEENQVEYMRRALKQIDQPLLDRIYERLDYYVSIGVSILPVYRTFQLEI